MEVFFDGGLLVMLLDGMVYDEFFYFEYCVCIYDLEDVCSVVDL